MVSTRLQDKQHKVKRFQMKRIPGETSKLTLWWERIVSTKNKLYFGLEQTERINRLLLIGVRLRLE